MGVLQLLQTVGLSLEMMRRSTSPMVSRPRRIEPARSARSTPRTLRTSLTNRSAIGKATPSVMRCLLDSHNSIPRLEILDLLGAKTRHLGEGAAVEGAFEILKTRDVEFLVKFASVFGPRPGMLMRSMSSSGIPFRSWSYRRIRCVLMYSSIIAARSVPIPVMSFSLPSFEVVSRSSFRVPER